jgi:hypothetical protein
VEFFEKGDDENLDYQIDWSAWLGDRHARDEHLVDRCCRADGRVQLAIANDDDAVVVGRHGR